MNAAGRSLALLGSGYWGKNLARCHDGLGSLAAICDPDAERLAPFGDLYPDCRLETDWRAVLADESLSEVVIATPPATHFELVAEALRAGKDVYVEKPLCHSLDELYELRRLADAGGRILMVGHLLHYHPIMRRLTGLLQEGAIGRVRFCESRRVNIGKIYTERNVLWNFGPHDATLVLAALPTDARLVEVVCTGVDALEPGVYDTVSITARFDNAATAVITLSWIHPIKEQRLLVYGETGSLVFDDTRPWDEKLCHFPGYDGVPDGRQGPAVLPDPVAIPVDQGEPLGAECAHFLACCRERTEPDTGPTQALRVQTLLDAAQRSLDAGGVPVTVAG